MFCSSCGAKNAAESNFCRQCGRKLDRASSPKISEEAFDRALPESEQVTALLERAYRLRKASDLPGAIALCKEVLDIRPDSTTAHGLLGQLYEQNGERDRAVEQYERVLQLNPGSIADRVKLDDLREGGPKRPEARNSVPKVVIIDPNGAPIRGAMAWGGVGVAALLILSGAALAIAFNHHTPENPGDARIGVYPPKAGVTVERTPGGDSKPGGTGSTPVQPSLGAGPGAATSASSRSATSNNGLAYSFPPPAMQYGGPPVYVFPQQGIVQRQPASSPGVPSGAARRAPKTGTPPERVPTDGDIQDSQRIVLNVSDGSNGGDAHNPTIRISKSTDSASTPNSASTSKSGSTAGHDPGSSMKIREHPGPVDNSSATAPSSEANALIAVGQEKLNKMDYAGANIAFRKALAGANDEAAYVYQKMAETDQALNDNKNALAMYEKARDEYKKLMTAGRQVDRATEGIRVCQTGITICSRE
jgi:tetratricopeptide (TPR) repeat protein